MLAWFFEFIRAEKKYTALFVLVAAVYIVLWLGYQSAPEDRPSSPALEEFQRAEKKWHERLQDSKFIENYLKERPSLAAAFQIFSMFILLVLSVGVMLDLFLIFKPAWRLRLARSSLSEAVPWSFPMLFKVIVLWMTAGLLTGILINVFRRFVLPHLSMNFYALFHTTIMDFLCFLIILYILHRFQGSWRDLGLDMRGLNIFKEAGIGIAGYAAVLPAFVGLLMVLITIANFFAYEPAPHPLVEVFLEEEKRSPLLITYSIVLACVIGPFFEEIFFRGFCYPIFKHHWGMKWGMVLSSAFFALIHYNQFAFWPIFVLGMALAFLYEKRKNLFAPVTLHMIHNSIFIGYFFFAKQIVLHEAGG